MKSNTHQMIKFMLYTSCSKPCIFVNKYTGFTARCIQHEFDHLMGVTFHKRAHPVHLQSARNKMKKLNRIKKKKKVDLIT